MQLAALFVLGLLVGGGLAWVLRSSAMRSTYEPQIREAATRVASAEATVDSLRRQGEKEQQELALLRAKLEAEQKERVRTQALLEVEHKNLEENRTAFNEAREKLSDAFKALAGEVLGAQSESFLHLARETFGTLRAEAEGDLAKRQEAIEGLVVPLKESLVRYESQIKEIEAARQNAYGTLQEQLRSLQKETGVLTTALRTPQVRGRWGEMTLRRVAELAGMSEHCDFNEQETLNGDYGRLRPDMIVNLPGGRRIAVDAKAPLQAFLDAASAASEEERRNCLAHHSQLVRTHMTQLGAKGYSEQFEQAPELVVLFLPGESFFSAALEEDRTLIEDGMEKHVIIATPTTLIALLRAVAYGWRQERIQRNAQELSDLGKQLYDRINTFITHVQAMGISLGKAVENYNKAVGSLESRVLIPARRLRDLGAATGEELKEVEPVDQVPRELSVPERVAQLTFNGGEETTSSTGPEAGDKESKPAGN
jgi:DNA recombination protein RmuC